MACSKFIVALLTICIRQLFISYAMIGFLLLVSLIASALITGLSQFMGTLVGEAEVIAYGLDLVVSFAFVTLLFALIYKCGGPNSAGSR